MAKQIRKSDSDITAIRKLISQRIAIEGGSSVMASTVSRPANVSVTSGGTGTPTPPSSPKILGSLYLSPAFTTLVDAQRSKIVGAGGVQLLDSDIESAIIIKGNQILDWFAWVEL